jgi:hypothetical protein
MLADVAEPGSADLDAMQPRAESRVPGESGRLGLADVVAAGVRPGRAVARLWAGRCPVRVTM